VWEDYCPDGVETAVAGGSEVSPRP
jgi:hypothetical protein